MLGKIGNMADRPSAFHHIHPLAFVSRELCFTNHSFRTQSAKGIGYRALAFKHNSSLTCCKEKFNSGSINSVLWDLNLYSTKQKMWRPREKNNGWPPWETKRPGTWRFWLKEKRDFQLDWSQEFRWILVFFSFTRTGVQAQVPSEQQWSFTTLPSSLTNNSLGTFMTQHHFGARTQAYN